MSKNQPKKNEPPAITSAEWEVMKALWERGPLAARDIYAALPPDHRWAYNTVKTLIARLVSKGAVAYEQIGNSYLYRSAVSRDKAVRHEVRGFIERVLDGSLLPMISHFIEERDLSDEEVTQLRRLLEKPAEPVKSRSRKEKSR